MLAKKQLDFSERALLDIADIEAYLSSENPRIADKIVHAIYDAAVQLEEHPKLGREGQSGTRELIMSRYPYTLVYRLTASKICIVTVLHQSRQYP